MKKFKVGVIRIAYSCKEIEVEAESQEAAIEAALDEAGNHDFPLEHSAEYEADGISEVEA
jgi:hypothetical protein